MVAGPALVQYGLIEPMLEQQDAFPPRNTSEKKPIYLPVHVCFLVEGILFKGWEGRAQSSTSHYLYSGVNCVFSLTLSEFYVKGSLHYKPPPAVMHAIYILTAMSSLKEENHIVYELHCQWISCCDAEIHLETLKEGNTINYT